MSIDRLPRWSWWIVAALILWIVWGLGIGRPLARKITEFEKQHRKINSELAALESRMSGVPEIVSRLNRSKCQLDLELHGFSTNREIDALLEELHRSGGRNGLTGIHADPELISLLQGQAANSIGPHSKGQLDTVIVTLAAEGRFKNIGDWLDEIERRNDFRFWTMCQWSARGEDGLAGIDAQAGLVVVKPPSPIENRFNADEAK